MYCIGIVWLFCKDDKTRRQTKRVSRYANPSNIKCRHLYHMCQTAFLQRSKRDPRNRKNHFDQTPGDSRYLQSIVLERMERGPGFSADY